METINYNNINPIGGSQAAAFEQLVCEIARNTKNDQYSNFIDNNGSGGDGGVECYWKLKDGNEFGWQAKFFTTTIEQSQWAQLQQSVETAIKHHPSLTRYYICFPRDLSDSRSELNGKAKQTERRKWDLNVSKWKKFANDNDCNVDFIFWGESELRSKILNSLNASTIVNYWFGSDILTLKKMEDLSEKSKITLGARFSEEINIDLPISKSLNYISENDEWSTNIRDILSEFYSNLHNFEQWQSKEDNDIKKPIVDTEELRKILGNISAQPDNLYKEESEIKNYSYQILAWISPFFHEPSFQDSHEHEKNSSNIEMFELYKCRNFFESLLKLIKSKRFQAGKKRILLINGPAGSGKSHLLCDFAQRQLARGLPVIHLLGQNYSGGDPAKFITESLQVSVSDLSLDSLEYFGKTNSQRIVIIIDALNEGEHSKDWKNYLIQFSQLIGNHPHLCLIISCRTTYQNSILGENIEKLFPTISHPGFHGNRAKAARKYLAKFGITTPDIPFLPEELTNPLFLRTICSAMQSDGKTSFTNDLNNLKKLITFYQKNIESNIARSLNMSSPVIVRKVINSFIDLIFPNNLNGVTYSDAYEQVQSNFPNDGRNILDALVKEGLLSTFPMTGDEPDVYLTFAFERFTDIYVSLNLMSKYTSLQEFKTSLLPENELGKFMIHNTPRNGVFEVLSVLIPEKFNSELIDLVDWKKNEFVERYTYRNDLLNFGFAKSLLMRSPSAFTTRTSELFDQISVYNHHDQRIEILIRLSLQPNHPWNASKLDTILKKLSIADRDSFWTTYTAINDYEEDDDDPESEIRSILNWASNVDFESLDQEIKNLLGIILCWFTTTVNLKTREDAARCLTRLLVINPQITINLIQKFSLINDQYLIESLYASIYAAVLQHRNTKIIQNIIDTIEWEKLIKATPDVYLRDSLTGIYEYAKSLTLKGLPDDIFPIHKHPSLNPITFPTIDDIKQLEDTCSAIVMSAGSDFGDFGKHTMSIIDKWSATKIMDDDSPLTGEKFSKKIIDQKEAHIQKLFKQVIAINNEKDEFENNALNDSKTESNATDEIQLWLSGEYLDEHQKNKIRELKKKVNQLESEILKNVSSSEVSEIKQCLQYYDSKSTLKFNKSAAQRWVVKNACDLGWTENLFLDFESHYCGDSQNHYYKNIERIGKKYERIALSRLIAYISEQYFFIPQPYEDINDSEYKGIWQLNSRNIDLTYPSSIPACLSKQAQLTICDEYEYDKFPAFELSKQIQWISSNDNIPNFVNIINENPSNDHASAELVLSDYLSVLDKPEDNESLLFQNDFWYRINSCFIKKQDLKMLIDKSKSMTHMNSGNIAIPTNFHQAFFYEYPERNLYPEFSTVHELLVNGDLSNIAYESPLQQYEWSGDDMETEAYRPSRKLIDSLSLSYDNLGGWANSSKQVFVDPSINSTDRPKAIVSKDSILEYLNDHDQTLVWFIDGEKRIYRPYKLADTKFSEFSGFFYLNSNGSIGGHQGRVDEK